MLGSGLVTLRIGEDFVDVKWCWQAVLSTVLLLSWLRAEEPAGARAASFDWKEPRIGAGLLSDQLAMLDREREEYAENLAVYAANRVAERGASKASLAEARRLLAVSLQLAPRNKRALVLNYQLKRGLLPQPVPSEYSGEVLARLLFTRAQILRQQAGMDNRLVARAFTELAAEMDPRNDDAVYASELQRLDQGGVDWDRWTDGKSAAAGAGPAGRDGADGTAAGDGELP